jgi:hypothetical protein
VVADVLGIVGRGWLLVGAVFNGLGLWLLGVFFLGAAYVERREVAQ